jgi:hypothetical protein
MPLGSFGSTSKNKLCPSLSAYLFEVLICRKLKQKRTNSTRCQSIGLPINAKVRWDEDTTSHQAIAWVNQHRIRFPRIQYKPRSTKKKDILHPVFRIKCIMILRVALFNFFVINTYSITSNGPFCSSNTIYTSLFRNTMYMAYPSIYLSIYLSIIY